MNPFKYDPEARYVHLPLAEQAWLRNDAPTFDAELASTSFDGLRDRLPLLPVTRPSKILPSE